MIRHLRPILYSPLNTGLLVLSLVSLFNLLFRIKGLPAEVSLRIECAELMLQGKTPYIDFFVLDSPLALFLSAIPVKFASLVGLDGYNIRCTLVFEWIVSVLASVLLASLVLRRRRLRQLLWCQTMLITVAVLNIACVYQFGQPEHFLMLGMTPYLFARWLEYTGRKLTRWESLSAGIIGGLVSLLDPLFLFCPLAIEFGLLSYFMRFSVRLVSPLSVLIATSLVTYAIIAFAAPAMMNNYSSYVLPMIMADRQSFDMRLYGLPSCPDFRIFIYLMMLSSLFVLAMRSRNSLISPLLVLSWLGFAYFIAECKGYFYQAVPMVWTASLVLTIGGTILFRDLRRWMLRVMRFDLRPALTVSILAVTVTAVSLYLEQRAQELANGAHQEKINSGHREIPDFADVVRRDSHRRGRVLVLNNNVAPAYPAMSLQDRTPGSRIMWSFFIPILARMKKHQTASLAETERLSEFYYGILKEDLEFNPPDLALFETGEVWEELSQKKVTGVIENHFTQCGEAMYYSVNLPPAEYSNPNYVMSVFKPR